MRLTVQVALRSRPRKIHNIVILDGDKKVGELRRCVLRELGKANDTARGFFHGSRHLDEDTRFRVRPSWRRLPRSGRKMVSAACETQGVKAPPLSLTNTADILEPRSYTFAVSSCP